MGRAGGASAWGWHFSLRLEAYGKRDWYYWSWRQSDGAGRCSLHEPALVSHHNELGPVARPELGHDPAHVGLGGGGADHEGFGDFFVVHAAGDEEQDFALPLGQLRHAPGNRGRPLRTAGE